MFLSTYEHGFFYSRSQEPETVVPSPRRGPSGTRLKSILGLSLCDLRAFSVSSVVSLDRSTLPAPEDSAKAYPAPYRFGQHALGNFADPRKPAGAIGDEDGALLPCDVEARFGQCIQEFPPAQEAVGPLPVM